MDYIVTQFLINRQAFLFSAAIIGMSGVANAQTASETSTEPDATTENVGTGAEDADMHTETEAPPEMTPPPAAPAAEAVPASEPPTSLVSETEPKPEPESEPEAASSSAGVNVDVGVSSIYNFRGLNTFQENTQQDQNALFAPSVTWSIFDTGLSLGYWGAYQLTGDNKKEMVDTGLGHEQDIFIGYDLGLADDLLTLSFVFTYFFYPFADDELDGIPTNPSFIEPLLGVSLATVVDIGFAVSYFHGVQEELKGGRHAYFNFSLGKGFSFNKTFGMNLGAALGIKAWVEENDSNQFDLLFDWSIPINLTEQLYLEPGIHLAWTDLEDLEDDEDTPDVDESAKRTAGDEFMVYWSINVGANF
jgi:hypothetical protein